MRRTVVLLVTLALALGLAATTAGPAAAVGVAITSPTAGSGDGWGLTSFSVEVAEPGDYVWVLRSDDGFYHRDGLERAEQAGAQTIRVDAVEHTGGYTLSLRDLDDTELDSVAFSATSPSGLSRAAVSPATFYPRVVDGYRDDTTFSFHTDTALLGTSFAVFTESGHVVRRARLGSQGPGVVRWSWDGRTGGGHLLVPDRYRIEATVRTADRRTLAITSPLVTSATTAEKRRVRVVRLGAHPTATGRTGACRVTPDSRDRLGLVCRGATPRAGAVAVYDVALRSAVPGTQPRDVRWAVDGRGGSDGSGTVTLTARKVAADRFRVEVRVRGDRSYLVRSVTVAYEAYVGR